MPNFSLTDLRGRILEWAGVSAHPHRFGGVEFRYGRAEIGHIHEGGTVDIPFTRALRDELLSRGLAVQHRWVPDSGWTTFHIRSGADTDHALWLMRLSYLRYALKHQPDGASLLAIDAELCPFLESIVMPRAPK